MYTVCLKFAQAGLKAIDETPDETGDLPPAVKQQIRLRGTVQELEKPAVKLRLLSTLRECKPLDEFMNHVFKLDSDMETLQLDLRANGEDAPSELLSQTSQALLNAHLDLYTGVRGQKVVNQFADMLLRPLSSVQWSICGNGLSPSLLDALYIGYINILIKLPSTRVQFVYAYDISL
jgi:hypothetical protein